MPGTEPQIGDTLRAMVPVTESGEAVLLEVMAVPLTDDAHLLQIYSTVIPEIGSAYEALKDALLDWNLTCTLGAFGIYRKERQLYHKYNYILPTDEDPEEAAREVLYLISLIRNVIALHYTDAVRISG